MMLADTSRSVVYIPVAEELLRQDTGEWHGPVAYRFAQDHMGDYQLEFSVLETTEAFVLPNDFDTVAGSRILPARIP